MRAEYDSTADALAIDLVREPVAASGEGVDERCTVALDGSGAAISVELLYPSVGVEGPLTAAAERYGLDAEALIAAARSALAAPDREVVLEVGARSAA
ncbi:hypothetical protein [Miltoncostaea marina]|uniref:hypothetical protein n=1 Tax=Miltoncostaea marina TaxID=2843215 RepID=UPI001C3CEC24|nr:hypothetical protein [Miltoncostaea marina]